MSIPARNPDRTGGPLPDGASVGIVGAGPAGTFLALHLLDILRASGRSARLTLIDRKVFECAGPAGCNMCAGAIGPSMVARLERLGIPLDERVVRRTADGYEIHGRGVSVVVRHEGRGAIYTVFRGGGPVAPGGSTKSFDQHLLDAAVARGAVFVRDRVEGVEPTARGWRLLMAEGGSREFDVLIAAFGVNSALSRRLGIGYVPPRTWHTVQAEIPASNDFILERLRSRIHIVPAAGRGIRFLAITPKDDVLTLTGIGPHVRIVDLERERERNPVLAGLLPAGSRVMCHCHPQVPVGTARNPVANRLAVVGDAFISRHLKNGIESSCETAEILARALAFNGTSAAALDEHFVAPCLRRFRYDNVWGRILFDVYEGVLRKGRLSDTYLRTVSRMSASGRPDQERILWSIFAGDETYRDIARVAFAPATILGLWRRMAGEAVRDVARR